MQVTATEAKNRFGHICAQAKREPVFVEKGGRVDSVILSVEQFEALKAGGQQKSMAQRKREFNEKYKDWIRRFPSALELSQASFAEILPYWTGLGYNRRALYLKQCADEIMNNRRGIFPTTVEALLKLPGVGSYTAGAICVFAYNQPVPLLETNVRTVMIHHYFSGHESLSDEQVIPVIDQTLDRDNPRLWFSALFDYGSYLKTQMVNPSRKSKGYVKQSPLAGSVREVRGWIMKRIAGHELVTMAHIQNEFDEERATKAVEGLINDGLLASK